jgi:hypothetical protein
MHKKIQAYAITGSQKGHTNWSEVRLIDLSTGEEVKTVYKKALTAEVLNARTGKAILTTDPAVQQAALKENENKEEVIRSADGKSITIYRRTTRTSKIRMSHLLPNQPQLLMIKNMSVCIIHQWVLTN